MKHRLIFNTSLDDEVFYLKDTIFVNFNVKRNGISTSKLNGGFSSEYKSVFNHHLSQENIDYLEDHDVNDYLIRLCGTLNMDSDYSTGLITLAEMKNTSIVCRIFKNIEVVAITTAGVRTNASRAGDPSSYYEENGKFGTINTIILTNVNLDYETLLEAFMCATEAKTVALSDLKKRGDKFNFTKEYKNMLLDEVMDKVDKNDDLRRKIEFTIYSNVDKDAEDILKKPESQDLFF